MAFEHDGMLFAPEVKRCVNPSSERIGAFNLLDRVSVPLWQRRRSLHTPLTVAHPFRKRYGSNPDDLTALWCQATHLLGVFYFPRAGTIHQTHFMLTILPNTPDGKQNNLFR